LGLFRRSEFIVFEALAEVPIDGTKKDSGFILSENIVFNHGIANTSKVKRTYLKLGPEKFWTIYEISIVALAFFSTILVIYLLNSKKEINLELWPLELKTKPIVASPISTMTIYRVFLLVMVVFFLVELWSFLKYKKRRELKKLLGRE